MQCDGMECRSKPERNTMGCQQLIWTIGLICEDTVMSIALQQQELDSFFYTHISLQIHHKTTITNNNSNRVALTNMFVVWMSHVNKTH